jgi:outer membrane lipoprotein-sorting protein
MLAPLVLLLIVPSAEPNEAEKLFRQMETKIIQAKRLQCAFQTTFKGINTSGKVKGELTLAEGNKSRLEMSGEIDGNKGTSTIISNGVKLVIFEPGNPTPTTDVSKSHNDIYRVSLTRSGLTMAVYLARTLEDAKELKIDDAFQVSDFKQLKKEKVGDQDAQVIEFALRLKGLDGARTVTFWVDSKTNLPLKSIVVAQIGAEKVTFTETYSKLTIDGKIDPKKFELPKE